MPPVPSGRESTGASQNATALSKNAGWFADNDFYRNTQHQLELYRFIALSAAHETAHTKSLLDIGNGGLFEYPIAHIDRVVATDLFIEEGFAERYPSVEWLQVNALEMQFTERFDTVLAINTLHHLIGDSVQTTYLNLERLMERSASCLTPAGKLVLIESTMPRWFVRIYGLVFPLLLRIWPLSHPPTFQFHYRDILEAAEKAGLILREFTWIPKTSDFMLLGFRVKKWMAPIRVGKFVFASGKPSTSE
jgi:cyclopropane fatty-acyl-phospholipid synthase-like methyltransferase